MLTQFPTQKLVTFRSDFSSPPSRALENYAKASEEGPIEVTDIAEISEAARDKPAPSSGLRKAGQIAALGLSLLGVVGASGCASSAAMAQTHQATTQTTQTTATEKVDLRRGESTESAQKETYMQGVRRRTKMMTDMFKGETAEEVAENMGTGSRKIADEVVKEVKSGGQQLKDTFAGKDAEEVAEKVGKETRRIGEKLGQEGRKIGQEAEKVGKEIGNVAKGFWRGLTGKGKKSN